VQCQLPVSLPHMWQTGCCNEGLVARAEGQQESRLPRERFAGEQSVEGGSARSCGKEMACGGWSVKRSEDEGWRTPRGMHGSAGASRPRESLRLQRGCVHHILSAYQPFPRPGGDCGRVMGEQRHLSMCAAFLGRSQPG